VSPFPSLNQTISKRFLWLPVGFQIEEAIITFLADCRKATAEDVEEHRGNSKQGNYHGGR